MLGMLGYEVSEAGKPLIASIRDWAKALGVELLAGFGPAGLLLMFAGITTVPEMLPEPQKQPAKPVKEKPERRNAAQAALCARDRSGRGN